jgi:hypothetical protein
MKLFLLIGILSIFSGFLGCSIQNRTIAVDPPKVLVDAVENNNKTGNKPLVLVELFTSEGCSDCPPAERVLAQLENEQPNGDAEIITLALHVDYWDRLGWKDSFSSHSYSERQEGYAGRFKLESVYTPQMIVDGQREFIGSSFATAQNAISEAAKTQKATVELATGTNAKNQNPNLKVKISDLPAHEDSYVWLAIAENNLQTAVKRGENGGKTLPHSSVVREMKLVGEIKSTDKSFEVETDSQLQPEWNRKNLKLVVFVQGKDTKKIYGINKKLLG